MFQSVVLAALFLQWGVNRGLNRLLSGDLAGLVSLLEKRLGNRTRIAHERLKSHFPIKESSQPDSDVAFLKVALASFSFFASAMNEHKSERQQCDQAAETKGCLMLPPRHTSVCVRVSVCLCRSVQPKRPQQSAALCAAPAKRC